MALRLRRGTDAERLTITPLEGELIYTTDTEELFIGDGTTVGGNPVITNELADLTDVDLSGLENGDTIVYNQSNARFEPGTLSTAIGDLTDVDTTGVATGNVLKWNGAAFIPANEGAITEGATYAINIDGDVSGSVFADDSTLLVDGVNGDINANTVNTNEISSSNANLTISNASTIDTSLVLEVASTDDVSITSLTRVSATDIGSDNLVYGRVAFTRNDANGPATPSFVAGGRNYIGLFNDPDINTGDISKYLVFAGGKLSVGTSLTPSATLEVAGSIRPGVYADATARDAAIASPTAGEMVFVTDVAKFQGYDGSAWVNLN
jgi:hypothetical protein